MRVWMCFLVITPFLISSCAEPQPADLVFLGGKVATVDEDFSIQETLAVQGDKIIYVGSEKGIESYVGTKTRVVNCKEYLILPGLIDSHAHLHDLGEELSYVNITGTTSYQQIINRIAEEAKFLEPGEWLVGGRWDQNDWDIRTFPVHDPLSRVTPETPVYLSRVDGNAAFVNRKALEIAGIDKNTPDPFGGVIHRNEDGEPSGVLINRAMNLVLEHIPADTAEQVRVKFLKAVNHCLEFGLTGIHEAGVGPDEIALYRQLIDEGNLPLRIYAMLGEQELPTLEGDLAAYFRQHRLENYGDHFLSVRSVKLFFDGALGSRGAAFFEPYDDDPGNTGLLRITPEYIVQVARAALETDMGVNTHCIGIRGNRLCLDAYAEALGEHPGIDRRFRIEHAQIVRGEDIEKFTALGVIPAMQPTHCTSDMPFVEDRVGKDRAQGAYAWRSFLESGCVIPCGSDFPVESPNPLLGIYAAVTRQDPNGHPEGGWYPEQRMTIQEAIKGFTIWAAYAAFQEEILGSIAVGKLADFIVLDKDILTVKPNEILSTKAVLTVVGGKIRFNRLDDSGE